MQYIGEHLWPGMIGHFFVISSLLACLLGAYSFWQYHKTEIKSWWNLGRDSFWYHSLTLFGILGILLFAMANKYYEYSYVFAHVSDDLPLRYILSAFWEGQEGSFLLWMFWHAVLGIILLRKKTEFNGQVVFFLFLIQVFLLTMILGIYYGPNELDKIGSSPFTLVRDMQDAPIFNSADYLEVIAPFSNGLNILLQNYWMTIHPPTLFLGFALTSIPFCFAMAGLWKGDHTSWLKPAFPWALTGAGILGLGIAMGSAWAYEALSFGGYWAWDPVENTSLVPWILLVAGIHTHMIAKNTGYSIKSTYLFYGLTFLLTNYSTFTTRSGVFSETSVHSFTEMGLETQLLAFLLFFVILFGVTLVRKWRQIPVKSKEELTYSREFWLFIGSLVLLFSAVIITFTTSIPVYNQILDGLASWTGKDLSSWHRGIPVDPVPHYNKFQVWIAFFVGLLTGLTQFLRYKGTNWSRYRGYFWRKIIIAALIAVAISLLFKWWLPVHPWQYNFLLFATSFSIAANIDYLLSILKGNLKVGASAITHVGFGMMILGILASGYHQEIISKNTSFAREDLQDLMNEALLDNVYLVKNVPTPMRNYTLLYKADTIIGNERIYDVDIYQKDEEGKVTHKFTVKPSIVYNRDFKEVASANPSIRRYFDQDIFTLIPFANFHHRGTDEIQAYEDTLTYNHILTSIKDTFFIGEIKGQLQGINYQSNHSNYIPEPGDIVVSPNLHFFQSGSSRVFQANPTLVLKENVIYNYPSIINELGLKVKVHDSLFNQLFKVETELTYNTYRVKEGDSFQYGPYDFRFLGFNRKPTHTSYFPENQDIAVGASLEILNQGQVYQAEPVYFIRNNRPFNLRDYVSKLDLHIRFTHIDPRTESIEIQVSHGNSETLQVPVSVATDYPRDDYIILQAKLFPGINLLWTGIVLMVVGFLLAAIRRYRKTLN